MAEFEHPAAQDIDLSAVLFALSDSARLDIVRQLALPGDQATCQSVALDMPKSTRSHHLKVLRESGVVRSEPSGRERLLSLRRDDLESRFPGLLAAILQQTSASV
jgi:DNA-binding transcriptional ArsR family regulator